MDKRLALSAVITTLNNEDTIQRCLESVQWVDEIIVIDSGSTDRTVEIAKSYGAKIFVQPFVGYIEQKQTSIDKASHDWVLLIDSDEYLADGAQAEIESALINPQARGFDFARREFVFWKYQANGVRLNRFMRLFDRRHGAMNKVPVHSVPEVAGKVLPLKCELMHDGERSIHIKVQKINGFSTGLVTHKKRARFLALRMIVYPPIFFLRLYLGKRYFLDGWAGFISSVSGAFYVFLKYAKVLEARRSAARKE